MLRTKEKKQNENIDIPFSGGLAIGHYGTINKGYDEERFHSKQGHGFAAERANDLYDKLTGHKSQIVGDDNQKKWSG